MHPQPVDSRRLPWPPGAYASGDREWIEYLHRGYYLLGLLWVVGRGEQAIAALCQAAPEGPLTTAAWRS